MKTLSVYIALPEGVAAGSARILLRQGIGRLREGLSLASHVERTTFDACSDRLLARVDGAPLPQSGGSWMGVASADGTTYDEWLPKVLPTTFAWEERVRIAPYLAAIDRHQALIVLADRQHATLFRSDDGKVVSLEQWEQKPSVTTGPHMSSPPRAGFHRGTGGLPGADSAARQADSAAKRHLARVVKRVRALDRDGDWLVLAGASEFVAHLNAALESHARHRIAAAGALPMASTPAEVRAAVAPALARLRAERGDRLVSDFVNGAGTPLTAIGFQAVDAALEQGAVRSVVLSEQMLSDDGAAAEDVVRNALARASEVDVVSGDAGAQLERSAGGVAAHLRFSPAVVGSAW